MDGKRVILCFARVETDGRVKGVCAGLQGVRQLKAQGNADLLPRVDAGLFCTTGFLG